MKHFIVIRFSYPEDFPKEKYEKRLEIFHKYTLPSLAKQIDKKFILLILGGADLKIPKSIQCVSLSFSGDIFSVGKFILKEFFHNYLNSNELFIQSRLDNDDIILPKYTQLIKKRFAEKSLSKIPFLVDFAGYFYDLRDRSAYLCSRYINREVASPFVSMVGKNRLQKESISTVFDYPHGRLLDYFEGYCYNERTWVQLIHENNTKMNRMKKEEFGQQTILKLP